MSWLRPEQSTQPASQPKERVGDVLAEVRSVEVRAARMLTDVLSGGYRSSFKASFLQMAARMAPANEPVVEPLGIHAQIAMT